MLPKGTQPSGREHFPSYWKKCQHHKDCKVDTGKDPIVPQMSLFKGVEIMELHYTTGKF